jgi:hypothetical protein
LYNPGVERLDRTSIRALKSALDNQPLTEAKVAFAWAIAVGPGLARAGSVSWSDGRLLVTARSQNWRAELERAKPVVLQRLALLLGPDAVREARIVTSTRSR